MCSSYLTGYSEELGNSSYFTYYSEFGRSWSSAGIAEACVLLLIFVASVSTNIMVIYRGFKSKLFRVTTNSFILNLAVADLTFTLTIPFVAIVRITEDWVFQTTVCQLMVCLQLVCGGVVIWSLVAISVSRYRCIIAKPFRPPMHSWHLLAHLATVWISPMVICIPFALHFRVMDADCDGHNVSICTLVFPEHVGSVRISVILFTFLMIYVAVVPVTIMIFCYYRIFWKLSQSKGPRIHRHCSKGPILSRRRSFLSRSMPTVAFPDVVWSTIPDIRATKSLSSIPSCRVLPLVQMSSGAGMDPLLSRRFRDSLSVNLAANLRRRQNYRAMWILLVNVMVVFAMWTPIWSMLVVLFVDSSDSGAQTIQSHAFVFCLAMAFSSSFVNAVLYGMLNGNFRHYFHLRRLCPCLMNTHGMQCLGKPRAIPILCRNPASKSLVETRT